MKEHEQMPSWCDCEQKMVPPEMCGGCRQESPKLPRVTLRRLGVPEDMTAQDVLDLFDLPDDDDSIHTERR